VFQRFDNMSRRKCLAGSLDASSAAAAADLPPGPASVEELFQWPSWICDVLFNSKVPGDVVESQSRFKRMITHMDAGILSQSEFSGWDSQDDCVASFQSAFETFCDRKVRGFVWLRSCDIDDLPRRVLVEKSKARGGSFCVHKDINNRIPALTRSVLDALEPDASSPKADCAEAYSTMAKFLEEHSEAAFPLDATSECVIHQCRCPTNMESAFLHATHLAVNTKLAVKGKHSLKPSSSYQGEPATKKARGVPTPWWTQAGARMPPNEEPSYNLFLIATVDAFSNVPSDAPAVDNMLEPTEFPPGTQVKSTEVQVVEDGSVQHQRTVPRVMTWGSTVCCGWTPLGSTKIQEWLSVPSACI
jgi:hypothetical protein